MRQPDVLDQPKYTSTQKGQACNAHVGKPYNFFFATYATERFLLFKFCVCSIINSTASPARLRHGQATLCVKHTEHVSSLLSSD